MAQPSVASFFNTRKRAAADDVAGLKNRRVIDTDNPAADPADTSRPSTPQPDDDIANLKAAGLRTTRSGRTVKRIGVQPAETLEDVSPKKMAKLQQQPQKLVPFIKKGPLQSPRKKPPPTSSMQKMNEETPSSSTIKGGIAYFASKNSATNVDRGLKTPTKQIIKGSGVTPLKQGEIKSLVRKELNFDEVKSKLSRSAKLQELKASLSRIQDLEKTRRTQEAKNRQLREAGVAATSPLKKTLAAAVVQLKEFDTIELEVLTSPMKTFKTPTKLPPPTPDKNSLMSPRHTDVSKRVLFSPAKHGSPSKLIQPPAYQRYASLTETATTTATSSTSAISSSTTSALPLPYKYRLLIDIFKGLDSVCAMFHNRRECITFKKLKPAVQRMLRKNFTETHLAQIKHLYPEAFLFTQMKMRNYGSTSKADYFQLVVSPNVASAAVPSSKLEGLRPIDEDNVLASAANTAMNPHVMTERLQRFQAILMARTKDQHDAFLRALDPPIIIAKERVTRWHPDFPLEECSEIECGRLPQPPNLEKYSSARDILSTARNLFNCATPMERVMERYEAKVEADRVENEKNEEECAKNAKNERNVLEIAKNQQNTDAKTGKEEKNLIEKSKTPAQTAENKTKLPAAAPAASELTASLLKGVPKSLLEKIRAKQAAKALDAITRRPSQDQEATKYSRLPELARHLRNVFITERKSVLTLEIVIKKIQNSFRACLTPQEIESHLQMITKVVPSWIAFHEVRKTMYVKIAKDADLSKVVAQLEKVANEKSK